jgi:hypothetical protein
MSLFPLARQVNAAGPDDKADSAVPGSGFHASSGELRRSQTGADDQIDSAIQYASAFGGSSTDRVAGVAVDSSGDIYVTGTTYSADLPGSSPSSRYFNQGDVFLTKIDVNPEWDGETVSDAPRVAYTTYLGGGRTTVQANRWRSP